MTFTIAIIEQNQWAIFNIVVVVTVAVVVSIISCSMLDVQPQFAMYYP